MKKFLSVVLIITMFLLSLNGATVNAVIPGEDTNSSNDLKVYEYDVATGNITVTPFSERRAEMDPSILASSAVNGVKTSMGYTPIENPATYQPYNFSGFWVRIGSTTGERYKKLFACLLKNLMVNIVVGQDL